MDVAGDRRLLIHGFKSVDHGEDESRTFPATSTSTSALPPPTETSPITSPPYWVQSHKRSASQVSVDSVLHGGITLHDNTTGYSDSNDACWAKSVTIDEHAVVNGNRTGIGAFVVWNITIETLREQNKHTKAVLGVRHAAAQPPHDLPALRSIHAALTSEGRRLQIPTQVLGPAEDWTTVFSKVCRTEIPELPLTHADFSSRSCVLLNPEFSSSPVMKDFLFT
ncbi:hypothetical protein V494_01088 [Pseudogymnoascus sp. VKM F-4513 (FW-928)]|nr:hypothetical protein V494_01088 [Pseudogymnoascus sp. VKM F-4513 (FW-928)]